MSPTHVEATESHAAVDGESHLALLARSIEHAAHYLPSQGPISVFVHHNTLHAFEDLPFERAVVAATSMYGSDPYLSEDHFRRELARGRILPEDLSWALLESLGDEADRLIGFMGTRYHLRLAMLEHALRTGSDAELQWVIAETDALQRFRSETPAETRGRLIDQTRHWIMREYAGSREGPEKPARDVVDVLLESRDFRGASVKQWTEATWEAFTLTLLWRVCHHGAHGVRRAHPPAPSPLRHRDGLRAASGVDTDQLVHKYLIRFSSAFLDQGFAAWALPNRDQGYFGAFRELYKDAKPIAKWLQPLPGELKRIEAAGMTPLQSIAESLRELGVPASEAFDYIRHTLLALRGWAGIIWQLETNAEWAARPAPAGTLVDYVAVRLLLERLAIAWASEQFLGEAVPLRDLRRVLGRLRPHPPRASVDRRAFLVFQLAQVRGWSPRELARLSKDEWTRLATEIEEFDGLGRRQVYQLAYERRYQLKAAQALLAHRPAARPAVVHDDRPGDQAPLFQVVCCIDEREESLRRHLEEVEPRCETFGMAGFFGVAIYYKGVAEAQFRPLCPVNVKPRIFVREESFRSLTRASRFQEGMRRGFGTLAHRVHMGSRTFLGGVLTGMLGAFATMPLLARVLLPRDTARLRGLWNRVMTPPLTQLRLERGKQEPGPENGGLGFTVAEMTDVVAGGLKMIGLTDRDRFAPLIAVVGHGSSSLNNPQKAAYDCGACGGSQGGPNARAFAQMANDPRVRLALERLGLTIPDDVYFVGGYHNTCEDSVGFFDLDRLPSSHEHRFEEAAAALDAARKRNAHERCRRFESAPLSQSFDDAVRHVEGRAEDLSQTRPELGHATNALCVVGRRARTRGLFLDRRSFLTSYDASQDEDGAILTGLLRAVFPVCGGINLEYYFSRVDPTGYGCGSKLPHNITSLLGVMDGASSDLRPGLPWQMVELHEPIRILIVVETTPERLTRVLEANDFMIQMVRNGWVRIATLDPEASVLHQFRGDGFERYDGAVPDLPKAPSSVDWYRGCRDHLGFASIVPTPPASPAPAMGQEPRS
ncbi:DUF2309 domain-containing protein [Paludisphaera mucosa]|uniref:Probable inorganic carbon transporter subunit DabA n=1 Tax=Paludisphaera mucosa TaxID=3030827 RepID=A0ABT6FFQ0_9BACT|nr:DUF2309 domain-containing protein [Paludisphaera mucosa]